MVEKGAGHEVHRHARLEGEIGRLAGVGGNAVVDEFRVDGGEVGHHHALEAETLAQHVLQQRGVGGGGHVVERVESHHHRAGARGNRRAERFHDAHQRGGACLHRCIVAARLRQAIAREVLECRHHAAGAGHVAIGTLIALHHRLGEPRAQIGQFAVALGHAAPACVMADVQHRRPVQAYAVGARLHRGHRCDAPQQLGLPRAGLRQGNWRTRHVALHAVLGEEQRNAVRPLLDGQSLQGAPVGCVMPGGRAAQFAAQDQRPGVGTGSRTRGGQPLGMGIVQLPHLFTQAHAGEQGIDEGRRGGLRRQGHLSAS